MKSETATAASPPATNHPTPAQRLPDPHPAPVPPRPAALNGSPAPGGSRLPRSKGWSKGKKFLAGGLALFVLVAGVVTLVLVRSKLTAPRPELVLHKVKYDRLELAIVERGALESAKNSDIYCRVRAGNKGSTIASQIKSVIDDGSEV